MNERLHFQRDCSTIWHRGIETILLIRGGAVVLQERLSAHWPQARPASPTAAWDNAQGFWRYGRRPATWGRVAG
jgi:hypothetical protein